MPCPGQQAVVTVNYTLLAEVGAEFVAATIAALDADGVEAFDVTEEAEADWVRAGHERLHGRRAPSGRRAVHARVHGCCSTTTARWCCSIPTPARSAAASATTSATATCSRSGGRGDFAGLALEHGSELIRQAPPSVAPASTTSSRPVTWRDAIGQQPHDGVGDVAGVGDPPQGHRALGALVGLRVEGAGEHRRAHHPAGVHGVHPHADRTELAARRTS